MSECGPLVVVLGQCGCACMTVVYVYMTYQGEGSSTSGVHETVTNRLKMTEGHDNSFFFQSIYAALCAGDTTTCCVRVPGTKK